jgi:1-aminocyclopropane-1-carboxylate deaminase
LLRQFPNSYLLPEGGTNLLAVEGARQIVADVDVVMGSQGRDYDVIALPVATGGTLAGIATALPTGKRVLGISVLKGSGPVLSSQGLSGQQIDASFIDMPRSIQPAADLETNVAELIRTWRLQDKIARAENASSRLSSTASSSGSSTALSAAKPNWSIEHRFHCGGYARCPAYLREFILGWESDHAEQLDPVYTAKLFYALEQLQQAGEFTAGTHIVALHTGGLQGRRGFDF